MLAKMRKRHGQHAVAVMAGGGYANVEAVLPTGHTVLDRWVIGVGGIPYGQQTELWGAESSGKTTLLIQLMAMCQREKGAVMFRDAEQKMQEAWAAKFGLDLSGVLLVQEGTVETFVDLAVTFMNDVPAKTPKLVTLDSLAFLPSEEELKAEGNPQATVAANARAWSAKAKWYIEHLAKTKTAYVYVNQPRMVVTTFGGYTSTPGGNSQKHGPLLRLKIKKGDRFQEARGDGQYVKVDAVKNQMAPPHRSCVLKLRYDGSFDEKWSVVNYAKSVGAMEKKATRTQWEESLECLGWADAIPWVESTDPEGDK